MNTPALSQALAQSQSLVNSQALSQSRFQDLIQHLFFHHPETTEVHISDALSGEIDLRILAGRRVLELTFAPGTITHVRYLSVLPELTRFVCAHHQLVELDDLPPALVELDVTHNRLSTLDFSRTPAIQSVRAAHNQLHLLDSLPASLVDLDVDHNQLTHLDLLGLDELRSLHCSYNKLMVLKHLPASLVDLKMEYNPMAEMIRTEPEPAFKGGASAGAGGAQKKVDFLTALDVYMKLKTRYEKSVREKAQGVQSRKERALKKNTPRCLQCKRAVGMRFTKTGSVYQAMCGDPRQCTFRIELDAGEHMPLETVVMAQRAEFEDVKQSFVQQKMDTLFRFLDENVSAEQFKERLEVYVRTNEMYETLMNRYEEVTANPKRAELRARQMEKVNHIKESMREKEAEGASEDSDPTQLRNAVALQQKEKLIPEIEHLRRLKYDVTEMEEVLDAFGVYAGGILVQRENAMVKLEYEMREAKVVAFSYVASTKNK